MYRHFAWRWVVFAVLNAILYANLLPLWEGFDEPFHYAYAEFLSVHDRLPSAGGGQMALDVEESLRLAPASAPVKRNLPYVITYSEYFQLPESERAALRRQLMSLPAESRRLFRPDGPPNYEAQQTPLAYALLAPLDAWWGGEPLPRRVLKLRIVCGVAAALLQTTAALALARELGLGSGPSSLMMMLVVCAQMFYAATAHVANDWLAIGLSSWFVVMLSRFISQPGARNAAWLGAIAGAGMLSKAYFLVWAAAGIAAVAMALWKRRATWRTTAAFLIPFCVIAAPALIRNLVVHGSLSGMQQNARGVGMPETWTAAAAIPWAEALPALLRGALWTGNSTFNTFSRGTLHLLIALLAAGLAAWAFTWRRSPTRQQEGWLAGSAALFGAALLYACVVSYAYRPDMVTASPWYTPPLHLPLACLAGLGLSRTGRAGRGLSCALAVGFAYLLVATYVVKLIPMYGGCDMARMGLSELADCYSTHASRTTYLLRQTALGPLWLIGWGTAIVIAMAAWLAIQSVTSVTASTPLADAYRRWRHFE